MTTEQHVEVRGRLRRPVAVLTIDPDSTLTVRVDDDGDPAFWLEVTIRPEDLQALAPPAE
jgi:hypothetical protein